VLRNRHGVCQDFAHVQIGCLRALGLAARYVSGYLVTQLPPGQARLAGADASHAWVSVYCPGHGWIDTDPTNNVLPADRHITVAYGRDYSDVTPIKGVFFGGGEHRMQVVVDVVPG
jgi:transglutaminase-like putative cysteine protease